MGAAGASRLVDDLSVDIVLTRVSPEHIPAVRSDDAPGAGAVSNLPGYVNEGLLSADTRFALPKQQERDIDVGSRGRSLPCMAAGAQGKRVVSEALGDLARAAKAR